MQITAGELRVADVVRIPGDGEREIRRVKRTESGNVAAWFRGDEENDEPRVVWGPAVELEIQRPGDLFPRSEPTAAPAAKRMTADEARKLLIERLKAEGWRHEPRNRNRKIESIADPTDTFRVVIEPR